MDKTPGFLLPQEYETPEELDAELAKRGKLAGFTRFDISDFVLNNIEHFGVKGMHWGQRKASDLVPSNTQVKSAVVSTGKVVAKASVATGRGVVKTVKYANEHRMMTIGALTAANLLRAVGTTLVIAGKHGILVKAAKNREAAYTAGKFAAKALTSHASKINYAKLAKGAYKITTMV